MAWSKNHSTSRSDNKLRSPDSIESTLTWPFLFSQQTHPQPSHKLDNIAKDSNLCDILSTPILNLPFFFLNEHWTFLNSECPVCAGGWRAVCPNVLLEWRLSPAQNPPPHLPGAPAGGHRQEDQDAGTAGKTQGDYGRQFYKKMKWFITQ